jgi:hypothetical protein
VLLGGAAVIAPQLQFGPARPDATTQALIDAITAQVKGLAALSVAQRVLALNAIREALHAVSPFAGDPVDLVLWVPADDVGANDYNPNSVAPPEMALLEHSIVEDGYTQPIVAWRNGDAFEVVDGFHRNRVGKESPQVRARVHGYLPITVANAERLDRGDRIAATIRHNRARGKHRIDAMSEIVVELKRRNWSDDKISRELGMDPDEILRLCQITGLAELFADQEFSKSWDVEGEVQAADFEELTDDVSAYGEETKGFRTVNTGDENRIFHTYDKWECYAAGFYATTKDGMSKAECEEAYRAFLSDIPRFTDALGHVVTEWTHSCEHYLTNGAMNRIAWLGQAAACYAMGIPSVYRSGFFLLTDAEQQAANEAALAALNRWLTTHDRAPVTMDEAYSGRQSNIY